MTKRKYLRSLRNKLRFKFSQSTINSVVKDYDEYFEVGTSNKQSIEEMIVNIGTPSEVAKSLEEERDNLALLKYIFRIFIGVIFIYYSCFFASHIISKATIVTISSLIVITGPLGMWLILDGDFSYSSIQDLREVLYNRLNKKITVFTVLLYLCSIIFITGSAYYFTVHHQLPFLLPDKLIRLYIFMLENGFTFLMIPLIAITFNVSRKYYINTLPILFFEFGMIYSVRVLFYQYSNSNLISENMLLSFILVSMIPLVIGGTISLLSYQFMRIKDKKKISGVTVI